MGVMIIMSRIILIAILLHCLFILVISQLDSITMLLLIKIYGRFAVNIHIFIFIVCVNGK